MACMAANADSDHGRRVRCGPAPPAIKYGLPESFRILPAEGAYTLRDRAAQRRLALAGRFWPGR